MSTSTELMRIEEVRLNFEDWAKDKKLDMAMDFYTSDNANPYLEQDTILAYEVWCSAISSHLYDVLADE